MFPHDHLFKELLRAFFPEFLELFAPKVAERIDFSSVRFLEQEVFTDLPDGDSRRTDTIAEVRTVSGEPEIVLFHVEAEAERRTAFRERMWEYYYLLTARLKQPIYPMVIYLSPGTGGIVWEEYRRELFGERILSFRYQAIGLPDLKAGDYIDGDNLLGVALSSLMKPGDLDSLARKWKAIQAISKSRVSESGRILLTNAVEQYIPLSPNDEATLKRRIAELLPKEQKMISIYELRGEQRGIEKGIEKGILAGRQESLQQLLRARFPTVSPAILARVEQLSETELSAATLRILTATSPSEVVGPPA